ncbi:hypothetical protein [Nocardia acidivorans]|uniref:hypothetical protein n=1 Tax=Nocardia acidivorans TaxID=404580 RepID=UPI000831F641|nr:hypothetical protein [Nocardia acidivorans]
MSLEDPTGESPDVGFTLAGASPAVEAVQRPNDLTDRIANELATLLSTAGRRLDAAFALTVSDEAGQVVISDGQQAVLARPPAAVLPLLRELRDRSAESPDGPWWRVLISLTHVADARFEYDYGEEPFPGDHLFPVQAYLADLRTYPRKRLPVWLAAYIGHDERQTRPPGIASVQASTDVASGIAATPIGASLPPFPVMWSRWGVISAAFVAAKSPWGPRISTALGWFESATRSGSTLHRLPNGRAVLSGGVWNAQELDAAYNDGSRLPQLYRGAPDWVADPVLNSRAANGLLSFCYWWDGKAWYGGESPSIDAVSVAIPGVWSSDSTVDLVAESTEGKAGAWATALVAAAETGTVTRALLARALAGEDIDFDNAYYQLILAGVVN